MDKLRVMLATSSRARRTLFSHAANSQWTVTSTEDPSRVLRDMDVEAHDVYVIDAELGALPGLKLWHRAQLRGLRPPAVLWIASAASASIAPALEAGFAETLVSAMPSVEEVQRAVTAAWERHRLQPRPLSGRRSPKQRLQRAAVRLREARQASRAKNEFLAHMTHEIRTPITGIVGMVGLLGETNLDERQREFLEILESCNESLLLLINDVLDVSKIEAGRFELESIPFELDGALEETLRVFRKQAEGRKLQLTSEINASVPTRLVGDPGRLRQILNNFIGNALKFTSEGGVSLRVDSIPDDSGDAVLEFSVCDTGIGIPEDRLGSLFESYTQAETSTARRFGGTGLGLSISKKLALLMRGEVGVENLPGGGARFWFTARFQKQVEVPPAGILEARHANRGPRVILVHDQAPVRQALAENLHLRDLDVTACGTAREAYDALRVPSGDRITVVVMGIQEPENAALTLARELREDASLRDYRLIQLAEIGRKGDAARAQEAGFDAYLTRPYTTETVVQCIWRVAANTNPEVLVTRHSLRDDAPPVAPAVLVVEDDGTSRKLAVRFLRKLGFRVDSAENGAAGLAAFRDGDYAAVIMDCQMPEMDGIEAARRIRAMEAGSGKRTPIIALTAFALKEYRDRCLAAGMDSFLTKPVTMTDLGEAVAGFVEMPERQAA